MSQYQVSTQDFDSWLRAYQQAWQGRDSKAAAKLFTADAAYHWTPLDPPQRGPAEIAAAWDGAVSQQQDVKFAYRILAVTGVMGIATWRADFLKLPARSSVRIEGMLTAEFAAAGACRIFREWWHAAETPG